MHGHSYKVELAIQGPVDPATGWLIDFAAMDDAWADIHALVDHRTLNEVPGLENSTCENLAVYIWQAVRTRIPQLTAVTVWETADGCCVYRGAG
jgi:6-pyruvoyltetrahydropterin/6-carboxytetrahydropterin synthase